MKELVKLLIVSFVLLAPTSCVVDFDGDDDGDGDGVPDHSDGCPTDPSKSEPDECGCNVEEGTCANTTSIDGGAVMGAEDACPNDINKTQPGQCGCGTSDADSDSDGTVDCNDSCPLDLNKTDPGECGCGSSEGECAQPCVDASGFVDADGYSCVDWVGYDCGAAAENWGYTQDGEDELMENCPRSCGLCTISPDDAIDIDSDTGTGLHFVAYGDTRTDADQHQTVIEAIADVDPEVLLHTGDLWDGYSASTWRSILTSQVNIENLLNQNLVLVSRGNHEGSSEVLGFSPPIVRKSSTTYAVLKNKVLFISLENDAEDHVSFLASVLQSEAAQQAKWKVAFAHKPIFNTGSYGNKRMPGTEALFDDHEVDLFFSGHDHHYERSEQIRNGVVVDTDDQLEAGAGTVYFVAGGGGAGLYSCCNGGQFSHTAMKAYHFVEVTTSESEMEVITRNEKGEVIDTFTIVK